MKTKGIHHMGIAVPNRDKVAQWFVDNMGMKIVGSDDFHTFVDAGKGQFITIFDSSKTKLSHISFAVDDVDKAADELEEKGIKVQRGALTLFEGPDGLRLQISPVLNETLTKYFERFRGK